MKVIQFAFDPMEALHISRIIIRKTVLYIRVRMTMIQQEDGITVQIKQREILQRIYAYITSRRRRSGMGFYPPYDEQQREPLHHTDAGSAESGWQGEN